VLISSLLHTHPPSIRTPHCTKMHHFLGGTLRKTRLYGHRKQPLWLADLQIRESQFCTVVDHVLSLEPALLLYVWVEELHAFQWLLVEEV
jgi:hypothetical protein